MTTDGGKITGGCLCGSVRYEADQAPYDACYCHCTVCQKSLGGLFGAAVTFRKTGVRFLFGEPKWYVSSDLVRRGFCADCGSPIAYERNDADVLVIWIGTLDDPAEFEPKSHVWTDTKIPWADIQSHLPDVTGKMASFKAASAGQD